MPKVVDLVQVLIRAIGALILISGALQLVLSVVLIAMTAVAAYAHPTSPLGFFASCAMQMGVFSIGSLFIGGTLIGASGPLARFATKPLAP